MSYADEVLADSPRAWYRLAESSGFPQDSSGNGRHCTSEENTPTYQQASPITSDPSDFSYLFGGTYTAETPDNALLDLADVFTLEGWIKRRSTGRDDGIVSKQTGAYYMRIKSDNTLQLVRSQTAEIVSSTITITDTTTWHHCVATKNGATVKLYIDSVDRTGSVSNSTCADNALGMRLGSDIQDLATHSNYADAYLDEIAVYSTALTQARVQAHYNAASAYLVPVAWLRA